MLEASRTGSSLQTAFLNATQLFLGQVAGRDDFFRCARALFSLIL